MRAVQIDGFGPAPGVWPDRLSTSGRASAGELGFALQGPFDELDPPRFQRIFGADDEQAVVLD